MSYCVSRTLLRMRLTMGVCYNTRHTPIVRCILSSTTVQWVGTLILKLLSAKLKTTKPFRRPKLSHVYSTHTHTHTHTYIYTHTQTYVYVNIIPSQSTQTVCCHYTYQSHNASCYNRSRKYINVWAKGRLFSAKLDATYVNNLAIKVI